MKYAATIVFLVFVLLSVGSIAAAPSYPLKVAPGQRYLVDQNGTPFYMIGDSPQTIMVQVSTNDLETYLADRASRGFNTLWIFPVDDSDQTGAPSNYYGNRPFDGPDFTNEDPAYWALVDYEVGRMAAYGMLAIMDPGFVGLSSSEGFTASYIASSDAAMTAYGAWLGNRYKNYPNIMWSLGGDADPNVPGLYAKLQDVALGLQSAAPSQLIMVEASRFLAGGGGVPTGGYSSIDAANIAYGSVPSWLTINWVYKGYQLAQQGAFENYWIPGALPALFGEDWYEGEHSMTPLQLREEAYWECLSGCNLGRIFGNDAIWTMGGPYEESGQTWQSQLGSPGSLCEQYLGKLYTSREFWLLVPDPANAIITTGAQPDSLTVAVAAKTSDSHTIIAYIPTQRPITIGMTNISGILAAAWWYQPATGAATFIGNYVTLGSQTFTPPDANDWVLVIDDASQNYPAPGQTVSRTPAQLTWNAPAPITYGAALGSAQLSATALVPGLFAYSPPAGTILNAGDQTLSVTFTPLDILNFGLGTLSVTITVQKAKPVITWQPPAAIVNGAALGPAQLNATASIPGAFSYSPPLGTVLAAGNNQNLSVTFTPTDTTNYSTATSTVTINVQKATSMITWPSPAAITYGAPLNSTQLDATASVPGTFVYNPPAGTVLGAADNQTLAVTFTPTDTNDYTTVTTTTLINVHRATPIITWPSPTPIVYGTVLGLAQLDATANTPGTFTYTPALGTVLGAGNNQTLSLMFNPADATDYTSATATAAVTVQKVTPAIAWPAPNPITYGTALGISQLDATAAIPGTFVYSPAAGTVLGAGNNQTLSVTFTPADLVDFNTVTTTAAITVQKVTPAITWPAPNPITYGTALGISQLDATAAIPGTFVYSPAAGTVLGAGNNQTLSVTFTPTDLVNFNTITATTALTVQKAIPSITWPAPNAISYGTALGSSQLNATANVPGTFVYNPPLGTLLTAGNNETLSVTFTPTDATDYAAVSAAAGINVNPVPLLITAQPQLIEYGSNVPAGTVTYSGFVNGETNTVLSSQPAVSSVQSGAPFPGVYPANYTAAGAADPNYSISYAAGALTVIAAPSAIAQSIAVPTGVSDVINLAGSDSNSPALSLSFTVTTPPAHGALTGSSPNLAYTPNAGYSGGDSFQFLANNGYFNSAGATVSVNVAAASQNLNAAVTVPGGQTATAALPPANNQSGITATLTNAPGDPAAVVTVQTYSGNPEPGSIGGPGTTFLDLKVSGASANDSLAASFYYPTGVTNPTLQYYTGFAWAPVLSSGGATPILNATANLDGTTSGGRLSVLFDNTSAPAITQLTGTAIALAAPGQAALPTITWTAPTAIVYGTALTSVQLDATANVPGTFSYTPGIGTILGAGSQTLSVTFSPSDSQDYTSATASVTLNVQPATPIITWGAPVAITYGAALDASQLNATVNVPGTFSYNPALGAALNSGVSTLSATFTPNDAVDYNPASSSVNLSVSLATLSVVAANTNRAYGQPNPAFTGIITGLQNNDAIAPSYNCSAASNSAPGAYTITTSLVDPGNRQTNYTLSLVNGTLTVSQAIPQLTWNAPASINYGTPLGSNQLDAAADIPGSFAYSPGTGALLAPGTNSLSVSFSPNDAVNYGSISQNATLVVTLAPIPLNIQLAAPGLVLNWSDPASIFVLQTAPTATGSFTNVSSATSPFSNALTATQQFFRLMSR